MIILCNFVLYIAAIELIGNRDVYDRDSIASVICFSNFPVISMKWLNMSSNFSFTTEQIKPNELRLMLDVPISQDTHNTIFTCEVDIQLPSGTVQISTIDFTIRTSEERKILWDTVLGHNNVSYKFYVKYQVQSPCLQHHL